jgi:hypothetical protein
VSCDAGKLVGRAPARLCVVPVNANTHVLGYFIQCFSITVGYFYYDAICSKSERFLYAMTRCAKKQNVLASVHICRLQSGHAKTLLLINGTNNEPKLQV